MVQAVKAVSKPGEEHAERSEEGASGGINGADCMTCASLLTATEIILALLTHSRLPQVILPADGALVAMTLESFSLPWRIVRSDGAFTVVVRERE